MGTFIVFCLAFGFIGGIIIGIAVLIYCMSKGITPEEFRSRAYKNNKKI